MMATVTGKFIYFFQFDTIPSAIQNLFSVKNCFSGKPAVVPLTHGERLAAKKSQPITIVSAPSVQKPKRKVITMLRSVATQEIQRKASK